MIFQLHLSFSLYGADGSASPQLQWQFLNLFLQSVGIVLTDFQDVEFKYVFHQSSVFRLITSTKEVMFVLPSICVSVCLSVC